MSYNNSEDVKKLMANIGDLKTYAVIPAAGKGLRVSGDVSEPKQYNIVCDKPLIYHTINACLRIKWISKVIVVFDDSNYQKMKNIVDDIKHQKRVHLVVGSITRHGSIANGIDSIAAMKWPLPDIVVIHDGARPLLEEQLLIHLVDSAVKYGASGVICKLTSTVLSVSNDNLLDKALDRSQYFASETPQAFRYNLIKDAYNQCSQQDFDFNTECLDLVQKYTSSAVKLIEANPSEYFKVTFKKDIYTAEGMLREKKDVLLHCDFHCESQVDYRFISELREGLEKTFSNVAFFNNSSAIQLTYNPLIVRILIKFCNSWKDITEKSLSKCDSMIYLIITCDNTIDSLYKEMNCWVKSKTNDIKKFFVIHSNLDELNKHKDRLIKTVLYLSKQSPIELSGQIFFM
ncbi:D-ribitol-5-phosphate cytidylyltransferase-like [Oppia nitens]|uniref:D-ribitol-5-phosphate cytidylyltransferase-like n=1 Tax=Oppia nitens TaxID=1686743 RepID=UPI0023DA1A4B|nr:D-ribitol-5-phosphate cytidylyltransferase-like [Oppia nitens]